MCSACSRDVEQAPEDRDRQVIAEAFFEGLRVRVSTLEERIQRVADMLADHLVEHEKDGR